MNTTIAHTHDETPRKPLRLWPGVAAVALQWLFVFGVPAVAPDAGMVGILGGVACGLAVLLWWLFFSRAPWSERLGAVVLMVVALLATFRVIHESIRNGAMGMMFGIFIVPLVLSPAFVAWAALSRRLSDGPRRASLVAAVLLACGAMTLIRTGGMSGEGAPDLHWRWTKTPEELLLAQLDDKDVAPPPAPVAAQVPKAPAPAEAGNEPTPPPPAAVVEKTAEPLDAKTGAETSAEPAAPAAPGAAADWPGFRGPARDDVVRGVRIETDWSASPPVALWRRPIGPAWSSFAVHGDLLYTQEQRGEDEVVACYKASTGEPVWIHRDATRFWESNAGAGPRATPTLSNGRLYTFGATGIVNALDAGDGTVVWSRNAATDAKKKVPNWGFAGSPLVVGDVVVV